MWQVTGVNPLAHYLLFGVSEGRNPNPFFDSKYYLEKNPDVIATVGESAGALPGKGGGRKAEIRVRISIPPTIWR